MRSTHAPSGNRSIIFLSAASARSCAALAEPAVSATASVARCHVACPPTSLTATPSRVRSWAFAEARSFRFPLSECASGKCRWTSRRAT